MFSWCCLLLVSSPFVASGRFYFQIVAFLGYLHLYTSRHTIVAVCYGFTLVVRVSVRLSAVRPSFRFRTYFRFRTITWVNINWFSPNFVCALILWRSGLGLLLNGQRFDKHTIVTGYYCFTSFIFNIYTNIIIYIILILSSLQYNTSKRVQS